jgi:hypothetical protein
MLGTSVGLMSRMPEYRNSLSKSDQFIARKASNGSVVTCPFFGARNTNKIRPMWSVLFLKSCLQNKKMGLHAQAHRDPATELL